MLKYLACSLVVIMSSVCIAADGSAAKEAPAAKDVNNVMTGGLYDVALPSQDSPKYWVIRSRAVNELTAFLTKKRTEMREKLAYFKSYIEQIGKTQDMLASDIKEANDPTLRAKAYGIFDELESRNTAVPPKRMSWEELVELSMKFEVDEGYTPVDINEQELVDFKTILKKDEQFCMKIRKETSNLADMVVKAWLYLGTIDKQNEFRRYMVDQKQQKEKAQEEKSAAFREQQKQAIRQQNMTEQQNAWQDKQDAKREAYNRARQEARDRQARLSNSYAQSGYSY
jgi:hypothetical protein